MTTPNNLTQPVSLVKYGNAVMVSTSGKKNLKETKGLPQNISAAYTEDILNSILPPREYTMDKQQLWYKRSIMQDPISIGHASNQTRCAGSTGKVG